jgi:hypothetical protein
VGVDNSLIVAIVLDFLKTRGLLIIAFVPEKAPVISIVRPFVAWNSTNQAERAKALRND